MCRRNRGGASDIEHTTVKYAREIGLYISNYIKGMTNGCPYVEMSHFSRKIERMNKSTTTPPKNTPIYVSFIFWATIVLDWIVAMSNEFGNVSL